PARRKIRWVSPLVRSELWTKGETHLISLRAGTRFTTEPVDVRRGRPLKGLGGGIVGVENRIVRRGLVRDDVALGGHVRAHGPVAIEVVRADIGDHRNVRAAPQ